MHRYDICVATNREMVLSPAHDRRIAALVVRDLEKILRPLTRSDGFTLELTGPAGGAWQFGKDTPSATISMDTLDFHILASDRVTAGEIIEQGKVFLSGDADFGKMVLENFSVPY
jgi:hypothetical protein